MSTLLNRVLWIVLFLLSLSHAARAQAKDPLAAQVTIYRDTYGVPHIVGETQQATFFGYGYAQAQDHLEEMMLQYRDARGRRSEVLGFEALGEGYLQFIPYDYPWDGDYLQRLLRTRKGVVEKKNEIDPKVYRILDGFARGVNAYIDEHRSQVPAWIDRLTAEDIEALERSQDFRFYSVHDALSKLADKPYTFPNLGSNHFAIAPQRSANGRVIHVEHTHMPWANRFQNYEAHLITPGELNTGGISWFGSPFFLDGFNDRITWSATYNSPNISDIYEEKLNPENPLQYAYDGSWRPIRVEQETFRIKGPQEMESVTLPLYYTHHGPIVKFDRKRQRAYSVKLPNFEGVNYSTNLYGFMTAKNLEEFKGVVGKQRMPKWNLLYSDARNIYWIHNGTVAKRAEGFDWRKPVPGWLKATAWGKVNVTIRGETFPMDGNTMYGVLHPDHGVEQENGQIHCNDGWGHLMVVMEGDPKEIWSLLPYGQSQNHASPHYNDQTRLHSRGQMKRFWFTPREILDHTESVWGDRERIRRLAP